MTVSSWIRKAAQTRPSPRHCYLEERHFGFIAPPIGSACSRGCQTKAMQFACSARSALLSAPARAVPHQQTRSTGRSRVSVRTRAQSQIDASDLAVLSQRVHQMKSSQAGKEWPGYQQWRESTDSPWAGFGEWRMAEAVNEQHQLEALRHRMSKPSIPDGLDVVEESEHRARFRQLDQWHQICWDNFRRSDL